MRLLLFILFLPFIFFLVASKLFAQEKPDLQKLMPKRFIDKIEILVGPNLILPNADSWTDFYNNSSPGSTYKIQQKLGLSAGIGLTHSLGRRFEIQARFLWERKGYLDEYTTKGDSGKIYKAKNNFKNDYLTISLVSFYSFGAKKRIHGFSGINYSSLTKSREFAEQYVNDQLTNKGIIILDNTAPFEVSILAGVGYFCPIMDKIGINIRVQGNLGLTDVVSQNNYLVRCNSITIFISFRIIR